MVIRKIKAVALLALGLGLCSIAIGDISGTGEQRSFYGGLLSLLLSDAPVDAAEAVVVAFRRVELLDRSGSVVDAFSFSPSRKIDLLALQGSNSLPLLDRESVAGGHFDQIRLMVDAAEADCQNPVAPPSSFVRVEGIDYPLVLPAGKEPGITLRRPISVPAGRSVSYVLDFDLRRSVAARGDTGCYNLLPTIRLENVADTGSAQGTVPGHWLSGSNCLADSVSGRGAAVYAYTGANVRPSDMVGARGGPFATDTIAPHPNRPGRFVFDLGFLPAGDYTLAFTCQAALDDAQRRDEIDFVSSHNVEVIAGRTSRSHFGP